MSNIILRRANVVKSVDSEDKAKALEAKGFVRDGAEKRAAVDFTSENAELKKELATAATETKKLKKELSETEEKLKEATAYAEAADKKIEELTAELDGTKEQLEAAVKKNKEAAKK